MVVKYGERQILSSILSGGKNVFPLYFTERSESFNMRNAIGMWCKLSMNKRDQNTDTWLMKNIDKQQHQYVLPKAPPSVR